MPRSFTRSSLSTFNLRATFGRRVLSACGTFASPEPTYEKLDFLFQRGPRPDAYFFFHKFLLTLDGLGDDGNLSGELQKGNVDIQMKNVLLAGY